VSSPKIGRAFEKASNALAYQARKLREAATEQEVLDRLRQIGESYDNAQHVQARHVAEQQIGELQPLIEKAREFIADATAARAEARPVLQAFFAVPWESVFASLKAGHGLMTTRQEIETTDEEGETVLRAAPERYSTHTTHTRIAQAYTIAEDLKKLVDQTNEDEIKTALREAASLTEVESSEARYKVNWLRLCVGHGSIGETMRRKVAGLKKILAEVGEDVPPISNEEAR
jgi:hypothetical protein